MRPTTRGEIEIALFCALPHEADAVKALFDETYDETLYGKDTSDANVYSHGKINQHNVVLCYMPGMGKASAAGVAANLRTSYPGILLALVVGICGAVPFYPEREGGVNEIVLGDVLVSDSLVQYDFGKQYPDGFRRNYDARTSLGRPKPEIRAILSCLKTKEIRENFHERLNHHLQTLQAQDISWRYPGTEHDILYEEQYSDRETLTNNKKSTGKVIHRIRLDEDTVNPIVHIGTMASADTVMKSSEHRDRVAEVEGVIGFEMEGAGVWDNLPCVIIKGVCDYADSHKNKKWQSYAAATGASAAKAFLEHWRPNIRKVIPEIDKRCLGDLLLTDPRDDKLRIEQSKGGLLRESFSWVLEHPTFQQWWEQEDSRLLWIRGDAGKGKTMLMIGIIDELSKRITTSSRLDKLPILSYFLCQGSDSRLNNATCALRGLLYLLAVQQPTLLRHLRSKYEPAGRQLFESTNAVYSLTRILSEVLQDSDLPQIYLLIDAVDECEANLAQLLLLITQSTTVNSKVKWIVSSRNRDDIELHLAKCAKHKSLRLELNSDQISHAIDNFIDTKVSELAPLQSHLELQETLKDQIRQKSDGTFLWAALVIGELGKDVFATDMLEILEQTPSGLIPLFDQMMERVRKLNRKNIQRCLQILSAAALAYRPLHLLEMRVVAGLVDTITHLDEIDRLINMCSSFLTVRKDYVYFIHQSAKDYLTINHSAVIFKTGCEQAHFEIYSRSLSAMSSTLRQDICELKDSGPVSLESRSQTNGFISIKYACVHWFDHLCQHNRNLKGDSQEFDDMGNLHNFFTEHLLHWLESLGLMREVSAGVLIIKKLLHNFQPTSNSDFAKLLRDSMRLVLTYGSAIEEAPLQVYSGAVAFCPENSEIKRLFWNSRLPFIRSVTGLRKKWDTCLQVLEGHGKRINDFCLSPDSQTIATASEDCTINLWDATTGLIKQSLEGHKKSVNSISFLQDSQSLVSGSDDGRVLKWNTVTADCEEIMNSHEGMVSKVAFSMRSNTLIVGLSSGTILLRDPVTSTWNRIFQDSINILETGIASEDASEGIAGAQKPVLTVSKIIDFMREMKILSDSERAVLQYLESFASFANHRNLNPVNALHISPDGQLLACLWENGAVRLWYTVSSTWKDIYTENSVTALAFSPDSLTLALGLSQVGFQIWDTRSITLLYTIEHPFRQGELLHCPITALSFSQDGKSLYSALTGLVWRWSLATKEFYPIIGGRDNKGLVDAMTITKDNQILLLCGDKRRVYIQDTNSYAPEAPSVDIPEKGSINFPSISILSICLLLLAMITFVGFCYLNGDSWFISDNNVKIRDVLMIFYGIISFTGLLFDVLYIYMPKRGVRRRARETLREVRELRQKTGLLRGYETAQIHDDDDPWCRNPTTGQSEMKGHFSSVEKMALSPDGHILATSSSNIHLYDTTNNTWKMHLLEAGDYMGAMSMKWWPDSEKLCLLLRETSNPKNLGHGQALFTAKLFDVKTRACVKSFQKKDTGTLGWSYSDDGHSLVCVYTDYTMGLWDTASLTRRKVLRGHKDAIRTIYFSPDNQKLASVSYDCTVRLWDVGSGACRYVIKTSKIITECLWAPNSLFLALLVYGRTVHLWDIEARTWGRTFDSTATSAEKIAFSPGGHTIAILSNDHSVSCWDTISGVCKRTIEVEKDISHLSFSDEQNVTIHHTSMDTPYEPLKALEYPIHLTREMLLKGSGWIALGNQKLIWLPPDYRIRSCAHYNSTLALGHANGHITFFNLI